MVNQYVKAIKIPPVTTVAAFLFFCVIVFAFVESAVIDKEAPYPLPLITAVVSACCLLVLGKDRDATSLFARLGFHVGMFVYFLSFPILSAEAIDPDISPEVHQLLGIALVLTILGFEFIYWSKTSKKLPSNRVNEQFTLSATQQKWLLVTVYMGVAAWFITVVDYSLAADVSITDVLLTMRGAIEGAREDAVTSLGYFAFIFSGGIFLAVTSSIILLTVPKHISSFTIVVCWAVLLLCAGVGFLRGSRAVFLYSFTPLVTVCWIKLSRLQVGKSTRYVWIALAGLALIFIWGAMSAMRGADIRKFEGGWEEISPVAHAQGAFDIYSATAQIVDKFPREISYEYGKSLVPLLLGWVPRPFWPDKPYPFSLYANVIRGETLEARSASIAVGLPGEGYGNFGLFGAFLWGALMGLACRKGDDFVSSLSSANPLRLFLAAIIGVWSAMIVRGGVPEMFYMGLNVIMLPLLMVWALSRGKNNQLAYADNSSILRATQLSSRL